LKEKCKTCQHFKTILRLDGNVYHGQVCFGDEDCFKAKEKQAPKDPKAQAAIDLQKKQEKKAERAEKHGVMFREKHFATAIPDRISRIQAGDDKSFQLALIAMLNARPALHKIFGKQINHPNYCDENHYFHLNDAQVVETVSSLDISVVKELLRDLAADTIMSQTFMVEGRSKIADFVGIDLKAEWTMDEEYLSKKTKEEILDIYNKFNLGDRKEVTDYLNKKLNMTSDKLPGAKKTEMINLIIKSGTDLSGLVPDEISNQ
jgi:hypothetical protein